MRTIHPLFASLAVACSVAALSPPALATERAPEKHEIRGPAASRTDDAKDHPVRVRQAPHANGGRHDTDKVNINTADVKALMTLTGVGRKVAERIVEYRDNHGPFKKADELRKVEGVGTGLWEKNRDRIVTK